MSDDDCTKPLSYRRYRRVGEVTRDGSIEKTPDLAPAHCKPDAQILIELTEKIDDEISARNAGRVPQCFPSCDYLGEREVSNTTDPRSFYHTWPETFELRDADGNVIRGTAKYRARGWAQVETKVIEKYCDKPFGDSRDNFRETSFDPEKPSIMFVPGYSLKDLWKILPEEDRADMELIDGKKD